MPRAKLDLLLVNAACLTMEAALPRASVVGIKAGHIVLVAQKTTSTTELQAKEVLDCHRATLLPGFIDAHVHLFNYASTLLSVDCTPKVAPSLVTIQQRLREHCKALPQGAWGRAWGYRESLLAEGRHPTRIDLDAASLSHPIILKHQTGHAAVLNSRALKLVGIHRETPDPPDGIIERDPATGEPTGLVFEMGRYLSERIPEKPSEAEFETALSEAQKRFLAQGITSIHDAGAHNDLGKWQRLDELKQKGQLLLRVLMMVSASTVDAFGNAGLGFGSGDERLRIGPAKLLLTETTGALQPSPERLQALLSRVTAAGFPVAIHAVEASAVEAALNAFATMASDLRARLRLRLEHCSECPSHLINRLAGLGLVVISHPSFVYYNGDRYLNDVPVERRPWLYPLASLVNHGITVAAGSDAPVTQPNVLTGLYGALTRRTQQHNLLGPSEAIDLRQALTLYTSAGAWAGYEEGTKGSISPGKLADLVLLDRDIEQMAPSELLQARVRLTIVGGKVAWQGLN